ncbi:MAG: Ribonuclease H [Candidatus Uhrbacteria bacterium GW2011_GWE2_45_35]|uniref:Ribonuclease H n=2 Tax=Candidatus Uhriibacteriota TaxID=1752732 RepID=A0A0G1MH89_9BACT|nr:MAG: Ribonuclease H [Candidatus Uhrbacteria bacterium GW2011_GWF2_44_350]KKU07589.1 MAG: Ribonuclease H [Candidatus Uhrbacteria bacterium GW2011_GWE2_45_35]HBR80236.1 ribonuclease H [Candidatus Uhrbacteria bacterium]HCU31951.1 ribonuclease H [Candidatus Uhrbacteria bacterium]
MFKSVRIYTDGGARGNPGPAGSGAVIKSLDKGVEETVSTVKKFFPHATNNQAEYDAIIIGLEEAKRLGAEEVELVMDSELAVKQIRGEYRVKNPELAKKFLEVYNLSQAFKKFNARHIFREKNKEADALVNEVIDENI